MFILRFYRRYLAFRPFTEAEAWGLFRIAAIAEAVGWTLLIAAIAYRDAVSPGDHLAVPLAGRFHGALFGLYIAAVLLLGPSLRWSGLRILVAGLFSTPPFGSLVYEQWSARQRTRQRVWGAHLYTAYRDEFGRADTSTV